MITLKRTERFLGRRGKLRIDACVDEKMISYIVIDTDYNTLDSVFVWTSYGDQDMQVYKPLNDDVENIEKKYLAYAKKKKKDYHSCKEIIDLCCSEKIEENTFEAYCSSVLNEAMILESFNAEMKSVFSSNQLKVIGDFLSKNYISAQDSDFTHYTKKTFKKKFGAKNGYVFTLINGQLYIVYVENQRTYELQYPKPYQSELKVKDVFDQGEDYFVIETRSNTWQKRHDRFLSQPEDELLIKNHELKKKIANIDTYTGSINKKLSSLGFRFENLTKHTDGVRIWLNVDFKDKNHKGNEYQVSNDDEPPYPILHVPSGTMQFANIRPYIKISNYYGTITSAKDCEKFIAEMERCKKAIEIINDIDVSQLKEVD